MPTYEELLETDEILTQLNRQYYEQFARYTRAFAEDWPDKFDVEQEVVRRGPWSPLAGTRCDASAKVSLTSNARPRRRVVNTMWQTHDGYELDEGLERVDFARVQGWLAGTYWSPGVGRETVERAARHSSLVVGAYRDGEQVGYLRVVSDRTTFAWVCDVFVDEAHRGRGLARAMVRFALEHPEHQGLRRWLLATADAHGVYQAIGFEPLVAPERWLALLPNKQ